MSEPAPSRLLGAGVTRRDARLADGRDLFYYDDHDSALPPQRRQDARDLEPRPPTASMRLDPLTGEWISIAAARQNRAMLPPQHLDPLAPQSPGNPSEIPDRYDVAVFENRSPAFGPAIDDRSHHGVPGPGDDAAGVLGLSRPSSGRCEVICFSPDHHGSLGTQTGSRVRTIIEAWADRTSALSALPGVRQVFPFENRGEQIGVTLSHPHGQIYAYPYVTPRTQRTLVMLEQTGGELFEEILTFERASTRVVLSGEHWTAFVPYAARWPVEVHLIPHRQVSDITETSDAERAELAVLYPQLLRGIDALYPTPTPYIAAWHQAPVSATPSAQASHQGFRLHLQVTSPRRGADKLKYLAGSEAAMGAWVGDIVPEAAAERLRCAAEAS